MLIFQGVLQSAKLNIEHLDGLDIGMCPVGLKSIGSPMYPILGSTPYDPYVLPLLINHNYIYMYPHLYVAFNLYNMS